MGAWVPRGESTTAVVAPDAFGCLGNIEGRDRGQSASGNENNLPIDTCAAGDLQNEGWRAPGMGCAQMEGEPA